MIPSRHRQKERREWGEGWCHAARIVDRFIGSTWFSGSACSGKRVCRIIREKYECSGVSAVNPIKDIFLFGLSICLKIEPIIAVFFKSFIRKILTDCCLCARHCAGQWKAVSDKINLATAS